MIPLSKVFLRRLIDRAHSVVNLNHFVHLTIWERDVLDWWFRLFDQWNGRCLFYFAGFEPAPNVFVSTDYAGRLGFGAIFKKEWFAGKWPDGSSSLSIAVKELIPIVLAAQIWGCQWKHRIVEFKCDNLAVVSCSQGCFVKIVIWPSFYENYPLLLYCPIFRLRVRIFLVVEIVRLMRCHASNFRSFFKSVDHPMSEMKVSSSMLLYLVFPPWIRSGSTF